MTQSSSLSRSGTGVPDSTSPCCASSGMSSSKGTFRPTENRSSTIITQRCAPWSRRKTSSNTESAKAGNRYASSWKFPFHKAKSSRIRTIRTASSTGAARETEHKCTTSSSKASSWAAASWQPCSRRRLHSTGTVVDSRSFVSSRIVGREVRVVYHCTSGVPKGVPNWALRFYSVTSGVRTGFFLWDNYFRCFIP